MTARLRRIALLGLLPLLVSLGGCQAVLLSPSGDVAVQQRNLMLASVALMLIVIIPVMVLTVLIAWRYRATNKDATYDPEWSHSLSLEVAIWTIPLLIIVALGAITWLGTHLLDPYRPLQRMSASQRIPPTERPLKVQVVALDWKWLFIYPDLGIASLNELSAPVDKPIDFSLTATNVMNSFFVPSLAGQIYAMPGMQTKLHAIINEAGSYKGFSANYSGAGFSRMHFNFHGLDDDVFEKWVAKVKAEGSRLDAETYAQIEKPSEGDPIRYFSSVDSGLYHRILNLCTVSNQMCMSEMMQIDRRGGAGKDSRENRERLRYDHARDAHHGGAAPGAPAGQGGPAPPRVDN